MKKNILLLLLITFSSSLVAQIGISTPSPQGTFHVDGAKDNPLTGAPSIAQQANDFVVLKTGNVGIGTTNPDANAIVDMSSTTKGFLPPRLTTAQRNAIGSKQVGLAIYNSDIKCLQYWNGTEWRGDCEGTIQTVNCATGSTGNLYITSDASEVTNTVSYTGGNGGFYNSQVIQSTGVEGLTATLASGKFANGNGTLTYYITGTPRGTGTASFSINIGGKTCTITRNVDCLDPKGKKSGFYANPYNNTQYFRVYKIGSTYTATCFTCPAGAIFDADTALCIQP